MTAALVAAIAGLTTTLHRALAQVGAPVACPGVSDLLRIAPSQDVHLDVLSYRVGALTQRLHLCSKRIGDDWFDPAEEGRRRAMGLMFEWVGAFGCALTEYASAPSVLGRPLGGPRASYLREAAQLEALKDSYEAEADLRESTPLDHFRAVQLLAKIQSRWNKSTDADRAELVAREAGGDPNAAIALATLALTADAGPADIGLALALLRKATQLGSVQAPLMGAQYAAMASRSADAAGGSNRYRQLERDFLATAAYRGSADAMAQMLPLLLRSGNADDATAYVFWVTQQRGIMRDMHEIRSACL
ncbi:hypothetical protein FHP25_38080 [Vineibacter terrae]|uniref:Uncharacterized protein n=1 Tax=Vineibacter terrae TaxID=2586908 RepID=A0A5C8P7F8_9HYPH|nr:hypothetical protein [Vineibacter terrae]TXL69674.1 hypothetical protein FHP25_38080 [Vineibacter terrae]